MKKLKLPNGFGSISYYGEHRRRPYVAKKYIDGRQKPIGYYATYEDALAYLIAYNKNPSLFNPSEITFSEIFKLWSAEHFPKIAKTTSANYTAAYKHCEPLYGKKFITLKISDLQDVIRAMSRAKIGCASQKKCRQLLHNLYNYAVKYEIISASADISKYIDIDKKRIVYPKSPFNTRQLNRVKRLAESDEPLSCWAKVVVMMVYSGVRPGEFLAIQKSDVKLKQRYLIVRDSKTEAGRNRAVPISRKALPYFRAWMDKPGKTLITVDDRAALSYHRFRTRFDNVMDATNCHHTPHECRHTCATMLDNAGANETAVKRILGHASQGVTKGVYTHKSLHELKKAIDLI
ncbi:site-specific integrase [Phascolarctobacterium succinatutens]|uniref:site-specific integrase n=1 Tax=Phascolarctobacterium succinatutens TaxID=626940 RepID=UPI003F7ECE3F